MSETTYDWHFDDGNTPQAINPAENAAQANAAMQQVLAESTGPAPDVPVPNDCLVTLPVGIEIDGKTVREAEIRELTGEDEEALAKVATNSLRFFDVVLQRGVVCIGDTKPTPDLLKSLYVGDRDALLLAIRIATFDKALEMTGVECPGCGQRIDVTVDLSTVPQRGLPVEPHSVALRKGTAFLRFPTGADQAYILADQDTSDARRNTLLLERCLDHIEAPDGTATPGSSQVAQQMGIADRRKALLYLADHAPGPELAHVSVEHDSCGKEVPLPLTLTDTFLNL
ncbi:hypothetical protein [Streptomyces sp. UNOC14_S4]|uniref:T4 family baseplate hub assembly chaperone n=1 Tax=Streptomyces sp. UNOC14_S4 TaxID=2872340 RepID=UPI001E41C823|nr:hypothetical protein [Streptomyces sp. UNOC14_S4]MCC3766040.1 hypothetical protein [Streptomyces sp. UNOC14_S4]